MIIEMDAPLAIPDPTQEEDPQKAAETVLALLKETAETCFISET